MKSVSTQQFKEQQEMNSLFKEHGTVNTKPETETGSAYFYGFRVMSHDKKNETLDLRLYFLAEDDVLVSKITYCKDNPHTLIKHLRSDNLGTLELSEMLGTEIEYKNKNEQWLVNGLDIEIEKFNTYIDDWEPMNSLSEEQQFIDFHHVDESEEHPKKGHGMITNNHTYTRLKNEREMVAVIKVSVKDYLHRGISRWHVDELQYIERKYRYKIDELVYKGFFVDRGDRQLRRAVGNREPLETKLCTESREMRR